jgi:hypothetical protein
MADVDRGVPDGRAGAGWLAFAAALLVISGAFKILDAVYAFKYDDEISENVQTIVFERDPATWGWIWLIVGIVIIAAGIAAIMYLPWIYFQPIWTILSVTLAVLVIYALAAYGGRRVRGVGY